jgi:sugar lactone lactonase YvrE
MTFMTTLRKTFSAALPGILLFSCQRKLDVPEQYAAATDARAVIAPVNLFSGTAPADPVVLAEVTTVPISAGTLNAPCGVASDKDGNIYVADRSHNLIQKLLTSGIWTVYAGSGRAGHQDGTAATATFNGPAGVAVGANGTVYVADQMNNCIRTITTDGMVHTFAGSDTAGFADGPGARAKFNMPAGVAIDALGTVYVADYNNHRIRRISPAGIVTQWCGSTPGFRDGNGANAMFNFPQSVAVAPSGVVYVADVLNNRIRKIYSGVVTTLAGNDNTNLTDGTGASASFFRPVGVATDGAGNIFVADALNNAIRKVTPAGMVTTVAGNRIFGSQDGVGIHATFSTPTGLTVDPSGNIYIADKGNNVIRHILFEAGVGTLAGNGLAAYTEQTGENAAFNAPSDVALDAAGNIYVADRNNNRIRRITPAGVTSLLAGNGSAGLVNGAGASASFNHPSGIAVDHAGNVFVADYSNLRIRKITSAGLVTTFAGDDRDPFDRSLNLQTPTDIALDSAGNVYVGDGEYLHRYDASGVQTLHVRLPGILESAFSTLYGNAQSVAVDPAGQHIYVGDPSLGVVWKVSATGAFHQYLGTLRNPTAHFDPTALALDASGNIYVANGYYSQITKYDASGAAVRVVGAVNTSPAFRDDDDAHALFTAPYGLALNAAAGIIYVADRDNNRIRVMNQ